MLGDSRPYDTLPYYFSDQYNTGMEFWGDPALAGVRVVRGELDTRSFTAFWHEAGRVTAVLNMHVHHHAHSHHDDSAGHGEDQTSHHHDTSGGDGHTSGHVDPAAVEKLIRSGAPIRMDLLNDPDVPWKHWWRMRRERRADRDSDRRNGVLDTQKLGGARRAVLAVRWRSSVSAHAGRAAPRWSRCRRRR
jgi:hypothetical protein